MQTIEQKIQQMIGEQAFVIASLALQVETLNAELTKYKEMPHAVSGNGRDAPSTSSYIER